MSRKNPKVFISYSWDSEDHKSWTRQLASRLVENGVDVRLDEWHVQPGQSLTQFMEENLRDCGHSLIICTPNYATKSTNRHGGVGYEQQIVSGQIAAGIERSKFIPIVRAGNFEATNDCAIPPHFLGIRAVDMRPAADADAAFELLLRTIYNEPRLRPPPIGKKPDFSQPVQKDELGPIRLAAIELDGWQLESGVVSNERSPKTFHVPSEADRQNLEVGELVKLIFHLTVTKRVEDVEGERMWVTVKGRHGPYFVGSLSNAPAAYFGLEEEDQFLKPGSRVLFLPEHVISIMKNDEIAFVEKAIEIDPKISRYLFETFIEPEDRDDFLAELRGIPKRKLRKKRRKK